MTPPKAPSCAEVRPDDTCGEWVGWIGVGRDRRIIGSFVEAIAEGATSD